ncbi:MAG: cytochrome c, partial [Dehalococcoidia bacterium]
PNILFEIPPQTTTPTTTTTTEPTQTTTTPIMATWGELASRGARSFSICADCHGVDGGGDFGPEIIGTTLQSFGDAWRLFAYISTQMPQDTPGSLSVTTYQRILAFMLTESGFVQSEAIFDENELPNILLSEELDM